MNNCLIVIPARYGSKRFPGKPLAPIAGVPMLARVAEQARRALKLAGGDSGPGDGPGVLVATDDERIESAARQYGLACVMTPPECASGSDRAHAAARALGVEPSVVVNWQGDNPCTPPEFVAALIREFSRDPSVEVATPCVRLRWSDLDALRENKKTTPFSGTFAVLRDTRTVDGAVEGGVLARGEALYFSKRELPALRREGSLREGAGPGEISPLYRHIGLYAYRFGALSRYAGWPQGELESLEGLEQLRFLEHGVGVRVLVMDDGGRVPMTGIDSPEDVARAEAWLAAADRINTGGGRDDG